MSSSQLLLSWLVILVTLQTISCQLSYDCRRKGQGCKNAQPCGATGKCNCSAAYESYDCGVTIANKNSTACSPACKNGGTCTLDGATANCHCTEEYSGSDCSIFRVEILCFGNRKIIYANPISFSGKMFITGYRNVTACEFQTIPSQPGTDLKSTWTEGYYLTIPDIDTNCGNITTTDDGTTTIEERSVTIEYDTNIITTLDQILRAMCNMTNDPARSIPGTFITTEVTNTAYQNTSTVNAYEPLVFKATADGTDLTPNTPLLIGKEIVFDFYIPPETAYNTLIVEDLKATDTKNGGKEISLITNKCPTADSIPIISSIERTDGDRRLRVVIKIFQFIGSNELAFMGTVRICKAGEAACNQTTSCNSGSSMAGLGRRKRDSGDRMTIMEKVTVTTDPQVAGSQSTSDKTQTATCPDAPRPQQEETHCLQKTEIILVLALMSAAVFILMVACVVLTWRLLRASPKVIDIHPADYQSSRTLPRLTPQNF